jgi:hypothetical protein
MLLSFRSHLVDMFTLGVFQRRTLGRALPMGLRAMTTAKPSPYDPLPRTKKAKKTWKERADDKLKDTLDYEQNLVRRKEL